MPWTPKQMKLWRAIAHGWHKPGGGGPSQSQARKMEHEGISPHARAVQHKIRGRG